MLDPLLRSDFASVRPSQAPAKSHHYELTTCITSAQPGELNGTMARRISWLTAPRAAETCLRFAARPGTTPLHTQDGYLLLLLVQRLLST